MSERPLRLALAIMCVLPALLAGQAPRSDQSLFADAQAKERAVRTALAGSLGADAVLKAVRTVVREYEELVREHPASLHGDDALWQASALSIEAFQTYGDPHDQAVAIALLRMLRTQFPASPFAGRVPDVVRSAETAPAPSGGAPRVATVSRIERSVLPDAVRVTIVLDGEVPYREERLGKPDRFYVDLSSARLGPALSDGTIRYDGDSHPVRQIRIGIHPNNVVRVVLEAAGVSTCSTYPLYAPYRLVVECVPARLGPAPFTSAAPVAGPLVGALEPPAPPPARPIPPALLTTRTFTAGWRGLLPEARPAVSDLWAALTPPATAAGPTSVTAPARNIAGGFSLARQLGLGVSRIVIDPGHGGQDPGTRGNGTTEAEIVLDIALRLEKLAAAVPGLEVVLTRRSDVFVPLEERTAIANRSAADLFLSIHVNGSSNRQAGGVETYVLNFSSNQGAAAVAARENAASGQSMAALPDVVRSIALNNKLAESRDFATLVQQELVGRLRPANRAVRDLGVKQAPFMVLIGAAMPSVLAEVSFLSNTQEARLLKNPTYRQRVAQGLFDAIRKYQAALKTNATVALQ